MHSVQGEGNVSLRAATEACTSSAPPCVNDAHEVGKEQLGKSNTASSWLIDGATRVNSRERVDPTAVEAMSSSFALPGSASLVEQLDRA